MLKYKQQGGINMIQKIKNIIKQYNKNKKEYIENLKKEKNFKERLKKRIPNILTKSRILTPLIILPISLTGNYLLTTIIISLLGITDCFDGLLARHWNATSEYGRKLDAISDKMYALGILIPLIISNPVLLLPTLILEATISTISIKKEMDNKKPYSTFLGKFKASILYLTFGILYLSKVLNFNITYLLPLILTTNILQTATAIQYQKTKETKNCSQKSQNINEEKKVENIKEKKIDKRNEIEQYRHLKEMLIENKNNEIIKIKKK